MKLLLVIDIADNVAEAYEDFTVDYDLRGTPKDDQITNESIKYVEDCPLKSAPSEYVISRGDSIEDCGWFFGYNKCVREVVGDDSH